jgi:hypothetical protein
MEEKLSIRFKNGNEKFSDIRVSMVLELLAWIFYLQGSLT